MNRRIQASCLGLVLLSIVACGSEPVPRVAAAGTTISIAIPPTYRTGFGHALSDPMSRVFLTTSLNLTTPYSPGSAAEDEARGELVFSLYGPAGNFRTYLPVRYVTRVRSDENSPAAVELDPGFSGAQTIALVDIPSQVNVPNSYTIKVERYRRSATSPHGFVREQPQLEGGDWVGWGQRDSNQVPYADPHLRIPLRIVAGAGAKHNDFIGWTVAADGTLGSQTTWEVGSGDAQDDARDIVPGPSFGVYLHDPFAESPPGAVEFVVEYPREKIEILGVQLNRAQRSSALALLTPDTSSLPTDCTPQTGSAIVKVVDPGEITSSVAISYRLRDFANCGRLSDALSGVTIQSGSVRSFDRDGVEIVPATSVFVAGPTT